MSYLTLEQAKQIHTLALISNAKKWWTVDFEKTKEELLENPPNPEPLPFGSNTMVERDGWGNWYDFESMNQAIGFKDALAEMGVESQYSEGFTHTVFVNW